MDGAILLAGDSPSRSAGRAVLLWAFALGYMALIWALSAQPASRLPQPLFPHADKVVHAAEYGVLALLLVVALRASVPGLALAHAAALAAALAAAYGAGDEWHQLRVSGRTASAGDALADLAGAGAAAILAWRAGSAERKGSALDGARSPATEIAS